MFCLTQEEVVAQPSANFLTRRWPGVGRTEGMTMVLHTLRANALTGQSV